MAIRNVINLLQPELLPQKAALTLFRVMLCWGLALLLMLMWWYNSDYQLRELNDKVQVLTVEKTKADKLLTQLENKLLGRKPDPLLLSKLETMKLFIANKQTLLGQLTNESGTYIAGFAVAMTELADFHSPDISLQHIKIALNDMTFAGVSRAPQALPKWLTQFEQSSVLSGQAFTYLTLWENEQQYTNFVVSTVPIDIDAETKRPMPNNPETTESAVNNKPSAVNQLTAGAEKVSVFSLLEKK